MFVDSTFYGDNEMRQHFAKTRDVYDDLVLLLTISATLPLIQSAVLEPLLAEHYNEASAIEQQVEHLDRQLQLERESIVSEFAGLFYVCYE
ncbi:hypothetical protein EC973_006150 [Apophysomyces ossiformis]|uniref:Uncharacterized protein n=1 Tax=Apophysomyces ossiformis TaxID=679940 RepID=A0A8H7BES3_9FUNG|nr:hypothetical protein EC973_006150 [Apophysomyces ossiformis]